MYLNHRVFPYLFSFAILSTLIVSNFGSANAWAQTKPRASAGKGGKVGTFADEKIKIGELEREYRLVVPKSVDGTKPVPLVLAFHGFLIDSKDLMPVYTQLNRLAEKEGFVLAYLNGRNRSWPLVVQRAKPDLDFFDQLVEQLTQQYNIDLNRIYAVGMSNGGYFTHVLASQRSDKIAAIASHSAGIGLVGLKAPELKQKYAVFVAHGVDDTIVKVDEGRKTRDTYQKWGHPVEYLEVPKQHHLWAHKADVNQKIWDFFQRHPLRPAQ